MLCLTDVLTACSTQFQMPQPCSNPPLHLGLLCCRTHRKRKQILWRTILRKVYRSRDHSQRKLRRNQTNNKYGRRWVGCPFKNIFCAFRFNFWLMLYSVVLLFIHTASGQIFVGAALSLSSLKCCSLLPWIAMRASRLMKLAHWIPPAWSTGKWTG